MSKIKRRPDCVGQEACWAWLPSLYVARGLPFVAINILSLVFYKQLGLSNSEITFYTAWFYLPQILKPLWRPLMMRLKTQRWWTVLMQLIVGIAFAGIAFTIPSPLWLSGSLFFFWLMSFANATHDMAVYGQIHLAVDDAERRHFAQYKNFCFHLATIFGQGILVMVVGNLEVIYRNSVRFAWSMVFYILAGVAFALWLWHAYLMPMVVDKTSVDTPIYPLKAVIRNDMREFWTYLHRRKAMVGVIFLFFFLFTEGLLSKVASLFLLDSERYGGLGLSPQEYALVAGTMGVMGLLVGGMAGVKVLRLGGISRWLWPMALAVVVPNVVYIYLSQTQEENNLIVGLCLFVKQMGFAFGFTAYNAVLARLTASLEKNYIFCTSITAVALLLVGLVSGFLQEMMGYRLFFILMPLTSVFSLAATYLVAREISAASVSR